MVHVKWLMSLALLFGAQFIFAQIATAPAGDGQEGDPYEIASLENLYWISQNPDAWGAYFHLTADIDASATESWTYGWLPIGDDRLAFSGNVSGNGYTISGLYVAQPDSSYRGLFGKCNNAVIEKIKLTGATILSDYNSGILIGSADSSIISDCHVDGQITYNYNVAGVVGRVSYSFVEDCSSKITGLVVGSSPSNIGGVFGYSSNSEFLNSEGQAVINDVLYGGGFGGYSSSSTIFGCSSIADITEASNSGAFLGYSYKDTTISCSSSGAVEGDSYMGGFVGYCSYSILDDCSSSAQVSTRSQSGGFCGYMYECSVNKCHATGDVVPNSDSPSGYFAGFGGYVTNTIIDSCYSTGNVETAGSYNAGFIAYAYYDTITYSYSTGSVNIGGTFASNAGGFCSYAGSSVIARCYSVGCITGKPDYSGTVGGFIGFQSSKVSDCYTLSEVALSTIVGSSCGGFIGNTSTEPISNIYRSGSVDCQMYSGALVGYNNSASFENAVWNKDYSLNWYPCPPNSSSTIQSEAASLSDMKSAATYSGWDFTDTWSIAEGQSFPILKGVDNVAMAFADTLDVLVPFDSNMSSEMIAQLVANDVDADNPDAVLTARWHPYYSNTEYKALYQVGSIIGSDTVWGASSFVVSSVQVAIGNYADLCKIGQDPAYPLYGNYILSGDIDASPSITANGGKGFMPIGADTAYFTGTFDGQFYTISNLIINRDTLTNGLFGTCFHAQVKNLQLKNCSVSGEEYTGIIAGAFHGGNIYACSAENSNCSGVSYTGGLIGRTTGVMEQCSFSGTVNGGSYAGGLCGATAGFMSDCYVRGSVSADDYAGGLTGSVGYDIIVSSYSTADVTSAGTYGALAAAGGSGPVSNCPWDKEATGLTYGYGWDETMMLDYGFTTADMKSVDIYSAISWDFQGETENGTDDIWVLADELNDGYPILSWQLGNYGKRLEEGWNLVVITKEMVDASVETVFAPVLNDIIMIKDDEDIFSPLYPDYLNTLQELEVGKAYLVESGVPVSLYLPMADADMTGTVTELKAGWNLVGYPLDETKTIASALNGIAQYLEAVKTETGFYIPFNLLSTIVDFEPGKGYFIRVSQDCEIAW